MAMHATPTLSPCVSLSQDTAHNAQPQQQELQTPLQGDSGDLALQAADHSAAGRVSIGTMSEHSPRSFNNRSEPSMDVLLSRINDSDITPPPRALRPVQQAHVTKCVVCAIL